MSKMDALRAMREERFEQAQKRGASASSTRTAPPARAARPARPSRPAALAPESGRAEPSGSSDAVSAAAETCGHKNMGGRTCTRPRGHAEKSHRYG